ACGSSKSGTTRTRPRDSATNASARSSRYSPTHFPGGRPCATCTPSTCSSPIQPLSSRVTGKEPRHEEFPRVSAGSRPPCPHDSPYHAHGRWVGGDRYWNRHARVRLVVRAALRLAERPRRGERSLLPNGPLFDDLSRGGGGAVGVDRSCVRGHVRGSGGR